MYASTERTTWTFERQARPEERLQQVFLTKCLVFIPLISMHLCLLLTLTLKSETTRTQRVFTMFSFRLRRAGSRALVRSSCAFNEPDSA